MKVTLTQGSNTIVMNVDSSEIGNVMYGNPDIQFVVNPLPSVEPQQEMFDIYFVGKPMNDSLVHSYYNRPFYEGMQVDKIRAIKLIRSTLNYGLTQAKHLSETPEELHLGLLSKHDGESFIRNMRAYGYECSMRNSKGELHF